MASGIRQEKTRPNGLVTLVFRFHPHSPAIHFPLAGDGISEIQDDFISSLQMLDGFRRKMNGQFPLHYIASEHLYNMTNIGLNIHSDKLCDVSEVIFDKGENSQETG